MRENEIRKLESEIHNEFQLERVVLFSDAVFAIAITLMVIELKFPEKGTTGANDFWTIAHPVIRNFLALVVSFFFIGMYWYRHLKLCGLLIDYNRSFIALNLLFLFFIVLFPFSVSAMMQLSGTFFFYAVVIYFANILFTTLTHFIIYTYLLGKGRGICRPVSKHEKKILLEGSFIPIIFISIIFISLILSGTIFKDNPEMSLLSYVPAAVLVFIIRRRIRKRHEKIKNEIFSNQK